MPRKASKTRNERVLQRSIDATWYISTQSSLSEKGYSKEQIDRLILGRGSRAGIKTLLDHHDELITHFSHHMLMIVAERGGQNIEVLQKHFTKLMSVPFNFTCDQIVSIVGHAGGSLNLESVMSNYDALIAHGFSQEQIVSIVSHDGGSRNIGAVTSNYDALIAHGFSQEHIMKIVGHAGGSRNIEAITSNYDALIAHGFSQEQILGMVRHNGGSRNIEAVVSNYNALTTFGFKRRHIVGMVSFQGSANLCAITQYSVALKNYNLTLAHISSILTPGGELPVLKELLNLCQALHELELTPGEILDIFLTSGMEGMHRALDLTDFDDDLAAVAARPAANKRRREGADSLSGGSARDGFFAPAPPAPPEEQIPHPTLTDGALDFDDMMLNLSGQ